MSLPSAHAGSPRCCVQAHTDRHHARRRRTVDAQRRPRAHLGPARTGAAQRAVLRVRAPVPSAPSAARAPARLPGRVRARRVAGRQRADVPGAHAPLHRTRMRTRTRPRQTCCSSHARARSSRLPGSTRRGRRPVARRCARKSASRAQKTVSRSGGFTPGAPDVDAPCAQMLRSAALPASVTHVAEGVVGTHPRRMLRPARARLRYAHIRGSGCRRCARGPVCVARVQRVEEDHGGDALGSMRHG
jgi:hypothetical protein